MITTHTVTRTAALILLLGAVTQAQAVPILRLTTDSGSVTVMDGDAMDGNGTAGAVVFNGALDGWVVNVTTGLSKPLIGSALDPLLDLNSVNVNSAGAGTLTIELSDTAFVLAGETTAAAAIGGVAGGSLSYKTFYDAGNTAFAQGGLLSDLGTFGAGAFSSTAASAFLAPALYSLTMLVEITHTSAFTSSSFNATMAVPEPGSIALLGAGLLVLAGVGRRQRGKS